MSADRDVRGWRRWREAAFATCTLWLLLQNLALFAILAWGHPTQALATGRGLVRAAMGLGPGLTILGAAGLTGFALAAWLVHAPRRSGRSAGGMTHAD
jgi:hypothetical protein